MYLIRCFSFFVIWTRLGFLLYQILISYIIKLATSVFRNECSRCCQVLCPSENKIVATAQMFVPAFRRKDAGRKGPQRAVLEETGKSTLCGGQMAGILSSACFRSKMFQLPRTGGTRGFTLRCCDVGECLFFCCSDWILKFEAWRCPKEAALHFVRSTKNMQFSI